MRECRPFCAATLFILSLGNGACLTASAQNLESQKVALDLILNAADRICSMVRIEGRSQHVEIVGNVKGELNGLIRKLADVGVSGTGKFTAGKYENVLRSDLAASLKNNAECKLKVFQSLQEKLLTSPDK